MTESNRETALAAYATEELGLDFAPERIALMAADLDRFTAALAEAGGLDPTVEPGAALRRRLTNAAGA